MRTLNQMIAQVKTYVRASENLTWDDSDCESYLAEAARVMWRHLAESRGDRMLRVFSSASAVPSTGIVSLPASCLRLEEVIMQHTEASGEVAKELLCYALPPAVNGVPAPHPWVRLPYWTDDVEERKIRVVGVPQAYSLVLQYLEEPVFPFEDEGTLRNPSAGAQDTYPSLPDIADSACEHLAAALMLGEELTDQVPQGYHGQQYQAYLTMMQSSAAAVPARRYVRRVAGR